MIKSKLIPHLLSCLFLFALSLSIPVTAHAQKGAEISFETSAYDFKKAIKEGDTARVNFKFTNTGDGELVITNVSASCSCVVPVFPKNPVKPGESGIIKVAYNSLGRPGTFQKSIVVNSNAKTSLVVLSIKGEVQ